MQVWADPPAEKSEGAHDEETRATDADAVASVDEDLVAEAVASHAALVEASSPRARARSPDSPDDDALKRFLQRDFDAVADGYEYYFPSDAEEEATKRDHAMDPSKVEEPNDPDHVTEPQEPDHAMNDNAVDASKVEESNQPDHVMEPAIEQPTQPVQAMNQNAVDASKVEEFYQPEHAKEEQGHANCSDDASGDRRVDLLRGPAESGDGQAMQNPTVEQSESANVRGQALGQDADTEESRKALLLARIEDLQQLAHKCSIFSPIRTPIPL